jgi:predicted AAA+ superfamily ATPase
MRRASEQPIANDLDKKIVLLSGPRQVGKTTLSKTLFKKFEYLNYDSGDDRQLILQKSWNRATDLAIFDEIHKMKKWKAWIKGIYDTEGCRPRLLVTGSARMNTYRKGGDSLAGRHFMHRLHPFTVKELAGKIKPNEALDTILRVGGFPDPFLDGSEDFARRWRHSHLDVILRQDLLDLERVRDLKSIELLIDLLKNRVGQTTSFASLVNDLQVSIHTIKHWLQILEDLFVIFPVRPYSKNIARSLLKESKYYFYDTGAIRNEAGARLENAVACALLAELQMLEDTKGHKVDLHYLRDKEKREVDFLAVIDGKPVLMAEVKNADSAFSPHLFHFKKQLPNLVACQIVKECKREQTANGVQLVSAAKFLAELSLRVK